MFVDEDYELYTYTGMAVSLTGKRAPFKTLDNPRILKPVLRHPHIYHYNCFGSYSKELMKTASIMDLETLLLTCISVASNLNFTDSTVIYTFCRDINNNKGISCIKDLSTGEWLTVEELQEKLHPVEQPDEVELVDVLNTEDITDIPHNEATPEVQQEATPETELVF